MSEKGEMSIGAGVAAAVKVALANTAHTVLHPIHTAKILIGIEQEKSIPEKIRDEENRMSERKKERGLSNG
jgi:hypothetical protein